MAFVSERHFILATRETGYRTASSAIAELIDNALQAGARSIRIRTQVVADDSSPSVELAVIDDGHGMDGEALVRSLRFGGTDRFDDRAGLGRFGMGLPNSSVSQARRVDVYSWTRPRTHLHAYLDVDEIVCGTLTDVAAPQSATLPEWLGHPASKTGTAVVWTKCDRISAKRIEDFRGRLTRSIGQWFRYFIWDGVVLTIDGQRVTAFDPLLCSQDETGAVEVGRPVVYEVKSPRDSSTSGKVVVRFSQLPVATWADLSVDEKRERGISKGAGVSIVRAGREIAYGWFFMGQKRKENYDDWWRCEIRFEPELDELFGVTHSKQGVRPSGELEAMLGGDLESIAHDLNRRVRTEFTRLKMSPRPDAATLASKRDRVLPPLRRGVPLATSVNGGLAYRVKTTVLHGGRLFQSKVSKGRVTVTINKKHPFFGLYDGGSKKASGEVRFAIDSLLLAMARAEQTAKTAAHREVLTRYLAACSDNLAAFFRK